MEKYSVEELATILGALEEVLGSDVAGQFRRGEIEISVREALGLLAPSAPIMIGPLSNVFSSEFFSEDNPDVKLYIQDKFKERILAVAKKVSKKPAVSLVSRDLTKPMSDSEICAEIPSNHLFSIDDLWMVAELISRQSNGESGALLLNGFANLFYFQVGASIIVVHVSCGGSGWSVSDWDLDEYGQWYDGDRVFSRNG